MGAKYSYGVWEGFAHQPNSILRTFKNYPTPRSAQVVGNGRIWDALRAMMRKVELGSL